MSVKGWAAGGGTVLGRSGTSLRSLDSPEFGKSVLMGKRDLAARPRSLPLQWGSMSSASSALLLPARARDAFTPAVAALGGWMGWGCADAATLLRHAPFFPTPALLASLRAAAQPATGSAGVLTPSELAEALEAVRRGKRAPWREGEADECGVT